MYRVITASEDTCTADEILNTLNSLPMSRGVSKVSYDAIKEWEAILREFEIGTKIGHPTDSGTLVYTKTEDGKFGRWDIRFPHPPHTNHVSEFDAARYMAGSGVISRGKFELM